MDNNAFQKGPNPSRAQLFKDDIYELLNRDYKLKQAIRISNSTPCRRNHNWSCDRTTQHGKFRTPSFYKGLHSTLIKYGTCSLTGAKSNVNVPVTGPRPFNGGPPSAKLVLRHGILGFFAVEKSQVNGPKWPNPSRLVSMSKSSFLETLKAISYCTERCGLNQNFSRLGGSGMQISVCVQFHQNVVQYS